MQDSSDEESSGNNETNEHESDALPMYGDIHEGRKIRKIADAAAWKRIMNKRARIPWIFPCKR